MQPEQGKPPTFSQIYIYDQEHELDNHMKPFSCLDSSLLLDLQQMTISGNPYAHKYLQVGDTLTANPACDIKLVLRSPSKQVDPHSAICLQALILQLLCLQRLWKHLAKEML